LETHQQFLSLDLWREVTCEICGELIDEVGDSGDNKDAEDLFFDDQGI
jgi:hypothetical protein